MARKRNLTLRIGSRPTVSAHLTLVRVLRTLACFCIIGAIGAMRPVDANAAKSKSLRKSSRAKLSSSSVRRLSKSQARTALLPAPVANGLDPSEKREHIVHVVRAGETLPELLNRANLSRTDKRLWLRAINRSANSQILPTGKEVQFYFSRTVPTKSRRSVNGTELKALEVDASDSSTLTWEKGIKGILFQKREKPFDVEVKTVSGTVEESLMEDGVKTGIQPKLLSQLADIFTWDVDLEKEIHKGDSYKILYEERSRKGQESKSSLRILAAELISAGQKLTAIYFEKQKGQGNYYDLEGRSLARSFLRFPLEFTSITSHLAHSRFNPILKVNLPHNGVDFAAQRGTPVRAVGDGIITQAGWNGSYGKAIDVQHDSTYMSRYAHLDRFAEGIQNGTPVKKGQIIGYVGSTGRSTGPHLHFELHKDQQVVDPLSVDFPADEIIDPAFQTVFDKQKRTYLVQLSSVPQS